jgi:hypothetical protein
MHQKKFNGCNVNLISILEPLNGTCGITPFYASTLIYK